MKAVIMAGGLGTRLRPLTSHLPKPMVPMANRPMMEHIVRLLKRHGLTKLVVLLYIQAEAITRYFEDGSRWGVDISYVGAVEDYGTAGSVKNAEGLLDERFLIISGDVLTDFDLEKIISVHQARGASASIALTRVPNPLDYGVVMADESGRIIRFLEKPSWGEVFSDTINTGIYILEPETLARIPPKTSFDFSQDLFPELLGRGEGVFGHVVKGYWRDVGNLEEYRAAQCDVLAGRVRADVAGRLERRGDGEVWVGEGVEIGHGINFVGRVILGDGVRVGSGSTVVNSVIGSGCSLGEEVSLIRSVLWDRVHIGRRAQLNEVLVANDSHVGEEAMLFENAVVSQGCRVGRGSRVKANVKIWPGKEVEAGATLSSSLVWGERWNRALFTEAKVTGLANTELSPEFGAKLGAAFGAYIGQGGVVVASRDPSNAARLINRAVICGILSTGVNVNDLRTVPIPVVRFELKSGRAQSGIHVRQSPYDEKLVDIIFFDGDGKDLPVKKIKAVERLFFREDFRRVSSFETGEIDFPYRVVESYREEFLKSLDVESIARSGFKVVIDYSNGSAATIFPSILGGLSCEVISLNAYLDPYKLTRSPEHFEGSLGQLCSIVTSVGADLGFLLDAGAEKLNMVDGEGELIDLDTALVLIVALYLCVARPRKIAVPVTASWMVETMASESGVEVIRTRNDHRAMMDAGTREDVDFVGGTRGGVIFPGFQLGCDAMFAVAKILELMAKAKTSLATLRREIGELKMVKRDVSCPWDHKGQVMRRLMDDTSGEQRQLIDGIRVLKENGWVLVLPDSRGPFFHIFAEAIQLQQAERLAEEYTTKVKSWQVGGED